MSPKHVLIFKEPAVCLEEEGGGARRRALTKQNNPHPTSGNKFNQESVCFCLRHMDRNAKKTICKPERMTQQRCLRIWRSQAQKVQVGYYDSSFSWCQARLTHKHPRTKRDRTEDRKIRQQIQPRKCLLLCETYGPKCKKDDLQTGTNDPTTLSEDLEVPSAKGASGVL